MKYKIFVALCFIAVSVTGHATEQPMPETSISQARSIMDNNSIYPPNQENRKLLSQDQANARSILKITQAYQKLHYETSFSRGCE